MSYEMCHRPVMNTQRTYKWNWFQSVKSVSSTGSQRYDHSDTSGAHPPRIPLMDFLPGVCVCVSPEMITPEWNPASHREPCMLPLLWPSSAQLRSSCYLTSLRYSNSFLIKNTSVLIKRDPSSRTFLWRSWLDLPYCILSHVETQGGWKKKMLDFRKSWIALCHRDVNQCSGLKLMEHPLGFIPRLTPSCPQLVHADTKRWITGKKMWGVKQRNSTSEPSITRVQFCLLYFIFLQLSLLRKE